MQDATPVSVLAYQDQQGMEPFTAWLNGLVDQKARRAILRRLGKVEQGLYGDCEPVGAGVFELRIFLGPGYRVYFGELPRDVVVLLCGGDKKSQPSDIKKAQGYWKECKTNAQTS